MGLALPGEGLTLHEVPAEGCAELHDRGLVAVGASGSDQIRVKLENLGTTRTWRCALLEYCRLDTEALMKVYLELRNLARG
jgi:hypothetical protein